MASFVEGVMQSRKSRGIGAAKFVVTGSGREIEVVVAAERGEGEGTTGGVVVVVEHEILQGFSGELAAF